MIDINTILQQALATAIEQATAPLIERINYLEKHSLAADAGIVLSGRVTALENQLAALHATLNSPSSAAATTTTTPALTEERVLEIARSAADEAIENHADNYNHDEYDRVCNMLDDYDLDDFVDVSRIEEKITDAIKDLTFTVSVE